MSVRVVRWDTGREHEVPEESLRWGPDTRQGTCRAQLLRHLAGWKRAADVPYVLPFSGAKWAVRVTLGEELQVAAVLPHGVKVRAFAFPGSGAADRAPFGSIHHLSDRAFLEHCGTPREKLGALLEAAGDALRAEEERPVPDENALFLLAECLDECLFPAGLSRRVRAFLESETAAEIRREWKGPGRG